MLPMRLILGMALAVVWLTGCTAVLPPLIVDAKNGLPPDAEAVTPVAVQRVLGIDDAFRVEVGPPEASLAVWVLEPRANLPADAPGHGRATVAGGVRDVVTSRLQPRGTVLVLHGFLGGRMHMLGHADRLRDAGYRVAVVCLRGHGDSTGKHLTYGVVEKRDISQVIDALESRGLITGGLGVLGMSYGATVAIEAAGYDPRIDAVVAMAGFSRMREETRHFTRTFLPVAGWLVSNEQLDRAIDEAGRRASFDPDDADATVAIARTHAPVLIVHGTWDAIVPVHHGNRLHAAAPHRSELMLVPMAGHIGVWMDLDGRIRRRAVDWFDQHLQHGQARRPDLVG